MAPAISSGVALRISVVVAAVVTACSSTVCKSFETSEVHTGTLRREDLCALERSHALDVPFREAFRLGFDDAKSAYVTLSPDLCAPSCGDVPLYNCGFIGDRKFSDFHPDVVPPPLPPGCPGPYCPHVKDPVDAGAPPDTCLYAESFADATPVECNRRVTMEECHPEGYSHGRRPDGYARESTSPVTPELGAYFAVCAHLEAASVVAFDALAGELAFHGFPADVLEQCSRAAREEVVHSMAIDALACRFGGERLPAFVPVPAAPRSLVDIAIENAVEGCVGEVFGAAEALFRARLATDADVRGVLETIAAEEAGHAELSLRIGDLLASRLDEGERARVREAAERAKHELRDQLGRRTLHPAVASVAGVPNGAQALAIFDGLEASFWAA